MAVVAATRAGTPRRKFGLALRSLASTWVAPAVRGAFSTAGVHLVRSRFSSRQLELYSERVKGAPRFVNLGAGSFRHPLWHNVDMPNAFYGHHQNIDLAHDFASTEPLGIDTSTVEVFYCSHVIEHLSNSAVQNLFNEVHRCLKPGGIFRVTCPDMTLQYEALLRRDAWFWKQPSGWGSFQEDLEQRFLEFIATLLVKQQKLASAEVREMMDRLSMEQFFDEICSKLPEDANRQMPEGHCNWFTPGKTIRMLQAAGFSSVWESKYLQSVEPKLRAACHFDFVCPEDSLYVECRK